MSEASVRLTEALSDRYRLEGELGQGGMATVYLAQDIRHNRRVAVKVLRPELAAVIGAERFLSEITTTANLQHPHILPLFDSGAADGFLFYVMPYVEGETVRDRISREKQLPVGDALRITREVASALDYAHRHGVIHRDIKPENILLHDGSALVADFGIALAVSSAGSRMTETGMSLGTPHYMSPEQAMGEREITARSDVYALGAVLYEMLTGDPPFTGSTAQAIVARVVTETPRPMLPQRHTIPAHVEAAVLTALEKLPADRFATAAGFATALTDSSYASQTAAIRVASTPSRGRMVSALPWAAAMVTLVLGLALGARFLAGTAESPPLRLSVPIPSEVPPIAVRLSPDGGTLAYISGEGDRFAIYTRRLDGLQPLRLDGTADAFTLSYSPDGSSLAFLVGAGAPRKVPSGGGSPVNIPLAAGIALNGLEFAGPDAFVVGTINGVLARLGTDGALQPFASPDSATNNSALTLDQVLPDGWVLARYWRSAPNGPILAIDPKTGRRITLLDVDAAWSGYSDGLLSWSLPDGTIFSTPWDLGKKDAAGPGRPLGATTLAVRGFAAAISVGPGALAYVPTRPRALVRVERSGRTAVLLGTDRPYHNPRVSPDGRRISVDFTEQERDVWLFDIADSTLTRFGFDQSAHDAEWLPDGSGLVFAAISHGRIGAFRRLFNRGGGAESLYVRPTQFSLHAIEPDGQNAIGVVIDGSAFDLVVVGLNGSSRFDSVLASRYSEGWPALSPDGRWLAYQSDESGRMEVYLRTWPGLGNKVQVSQNGGTEPAWSRDGRELFYRSGGGAEPRMVAALVENGRVTSRTELFSVASYEFATPHRNYDVFPDGRSFVMVRQGLPGQLAEVVYLQNVKRLMGR